MSSCLLSELYNRIDEATDKYKTVTKQTIKTRKGTVIKEGTKVEATYQQVKGIHVVYVVDSTGAKIGVSAQSAHKKLRGFTKEPSMKVMEKWVSEGISKSLLGKKVEMDGYDPYGMPSWVIVAGVV